MFRKIIDNPYPDITLVDKYESWMDGTMVTLDEENNIENFVSKKAFKYSDVHNYYKTVNIYKFSKEFSKHKYVPFLDAYCKALGHNEYDSGHLTVAPVTTAEYGISKAARPFNTVWISTSLLKTDLLRFRLGRMTEPLPERNRAVRGDREDGTD